MPAIDNCEPQVVNALQKAGWIIRQKPYRIRTVERDLYADVLFERANVQLEQIIIAEVKCFADEQSVMPDLQAAVGQYLVYRTALSLTQVPFPLYLAVPTTASTGVFNESLGKALIAEFKIKLVVIDLEREEIVTWLD